MAALILILGLLQMAGGIVVLVTAKSAIHEILATAAFGFGVISFALAVIIAKIDDATKRETVATAPPENQLPDVQSIPTGGWTRQV